MGKRLELCLKMPMLAEGTSRRVLLKTLIRRGNLSGKNAFQIAKRSLESNRRQVRAFSSTTRDDTAAERNLIITAPGSRKFLNLCKGFPKLFGINEVSEASMVQYSRWAEPIHKEMAQCFQGLAAVTTGPLAALALEMSAEDGTDFQFHFCEGVKTVQYCFNDNQKYFRANREAVDEDDEHYGSN